MSETLQVPKTLTQTTESPPDPLPTLVKQLILSAVFSSFAVGYLVVYVTAFLAEIGFSPGSIGLLIGLFGLVPGITGIPLGIVSDRKGRRLLLSLGLLGITPGLLVFGLTINPAVLAGGVVIIGLCEAAFLSTWNAMLADLTTPENRNRAFSYSFIVGSVFFGLGSAVTFSFPILQHIFAVSAFRIHQDFMILVSLLSLGGPLMAIPPLRRYNEKLSDRKTVPTLQSLGIPGRISSWTRINTWIHENSMMLKFSAINSLIGLGAGFIIPLVPTWFYLRFNIGDTYTGPLLAISGVTIGLSAFGSARVAKRYGQIPAIAMMTGASTLFMFSLAFIPNPIVAASLYLVRAALMNMASPLLDSFLMSITSSDRRGLASSINTVIWRLPNSGSTIIGGMILAAHFYNVPFIIAGAFYATSIILMYSVFRNVKPMQENKVTTHPP